MRMNILFTTHQGELAGSTLSIYYLAKGLADRGHHIHVGVRKESLLWNQLMDVRNVTLHNLPINSYLDLKVCFSLRQIITANNIEIFNPQGGKDRNLAILTKWLFRLHVQVVFTRRQRPRNEPWIKRWFHTTGTSKIITISEGLKKIFVARGYPSNHLQVIHNSVPSDLEKSINKQQVEGLRASLDLNGKTVIGCLSRKKSQEQLLQALKFLPEDYIGLFVGIGEHEVDEMLISAIKQRLIFTGMKSHEEALHYLKLMDVNVLPSYLDGFGLVLVESMLLWVPVIGSNFGGIPDVIDHGHTGLLFENGDPKQLADQIKRVLKNQEFKNGMIEKAREVAQTKFSVTTMLDRYENFFQSLLLQ